MKAYALLLVCHPSWNSGSDLKTIDQFFESFEGLVAHTESELGLRDAQQFAMMNDSETWGWDYLETELSPYVRSEGDMSGF